MARRLCFEERFRIEEMTGTGCSAPLGQALLHRPGQRRVRDQLRRPRPSRPGAGHCLPRLRPIGPRPAPAQFPLHRHRMAAQPPRRRPMRSPPI